MNGRYVYFVAIARYAYRVATYIFIIIVTGVQWFTVSFIEELCRDVNVRVNLYKTFSEKNM